MNEQTCTKCNQKLPDGFWEAKEKLRVERIKHALLESDIAGRPRKHDYKQIHSLYKTGLTMQQVADIFNCSTCTVHQAVHSPMGGK